MFRPDRFLSTSACLAAGLTLYAVFLGSLVAQAAAPAPTAQLHAVEKAAEESRQQKLKAAKAAEELAAEIAGLRHDSVVAAQAAQAHESALTSLEYQLKALSADEKRKIEELHRSQAEQAGLLMALTRLARNPPEALALASPNPTDGERSAILLGAGVPPLERKARALNAELDRLASVRKAIADTEQRHRTERQALAGEQRRLAEMIERKSALQERAAEDEDEDNRKQAKLAAEASNLKDLIDQLEAQHQKAEAEAAAKAEASARATAAAAKAASERAAAERAKTAAANREQVARLDAQQAPRPETTEVVAPIPARPQPGKPANIRPFAQARGAMLYPASGRAVVHFGDNDELGAVSKGLTFETRNGAQVVAPFDGRILFAGPFKGYGQIVIIEHGDGYHSLLAGLDRIDGTAGQWLIAGEPVGTMPEDGKPRLYLELRHDGQPINPLPWLATPNEKVSG